ncbi:MAG TPA: zf-HC2 domain-containing protein [Myxococcales bacterium]
MADHVTEQLTALLDGELSDLERARVEEHLKACATCAAEREALCAAMKSVSAFAEPIEPSPALRRAVLAAVDAEPRGLKARWKALFSARFVVPASLAAAAAIILLVVVGSRAPDGAAAEDWAVAEHLELLQDYEVVALALPAGVSPADADVVAHLDELGD